MPIGKYKATGLYRYDAKAEGGDGTDTTFVGPRVREGQIVELTHMMVADYTTAGKKNIVGFRDVHDIDHYINILAATNTYRAFMNGKMYLLPGEAPIGIVEATTSGDDLYFSAHGVVYEIPKS